MWKSAKKVDKSESIGNSKKVDVAQLTRSKNKPPYFILHCCNTKTKLLGAIIISIIPFIIIMLLLFSSSMKDNLIVWILTT